MGEERGEDGVGIEGGGGWVRESERRRQINKESKGGLREKGEKEKEKKKRKQKDM